MTEKPSDKMKAEKPQIGNLAAFDLAYFKRLSGPNGWLAIGQSGCKNQRYFTVLGSDGNKLGIVGLYDTDDETNVSHTIVDPKYRGLGLAEEFKDKLLETTGESYYVATVDLDNAPSLAAMSKIPGIQVASDAEYESRYHKRKFRFERPTATKNP